MERTAIENGEICGIENIFRIVGINLRDRSRNRPWTPDGIKFLIELYKKGYSVPEIAKTVNRTHGSVIGMLYDLGDQGKLSLDMWGSKGKKQGRGPMGDIAYFISGKGDKQG